MCQIKEMVRKEKWYLLIPADVQTTYEQKVYAILSYGASSRVLNLPNNGKQVSHIWEKHSLIRA